MLLATHRSSSWRMVSALWRRLVGRGLRSDTDLLVQVSPRTAQGGLEEAVKDLPVNNEMTTIANVVVLGSPAIAALDELFDRAGIDGDLSDSPL